MGFGHHHDTCDASLPVDTGVRRWVTVFVTVLVVGTVAGLIALWPSSDLPRTGAASDFIAGSVIGLQACDGIADCVTVTAVVDHGVDAGATTTFTVATGPGQAPLSVGTGVWLTRTDDGFGYVDVQRQGPLLALIAVFAGIVIVFSRWKGIRSLTGLAISIGFVAGFVLPAVADGGNAMAVAATGAAAIAVTSMGFAHGFSIRTGIALLGTVAALLLTATGGWLVAVAAKFTGLASEEAWFLQNMEATQHVDLRGLFLAGLVIGALGVLDDVTVTQVSAVWEVKRANLALSWRELYRSGMVVGRDHMAATVNTLALAYVGSSMPLLLAVSLSAQRWQTFNSEWFA